MSDPLDDRLDMPFAVQPVAPRPEAALDLRARLHRRLGVDPPSGAVTLARSAGLEYEEVGRADGEVVLFLHAGTATAYAPLMSQQVLASRYRLVRYHRRGYAASERFDGDMSIAAHVGDALRLVADLELGRVHVVAHSGSGPIAIQLALDAPDVVRSLVLEEPAIHAIDPRWYRVMERTVTPMLDLHRAGESRRAMERWMRGISLTWRAELTRTVPGGPQQTLDDAAAFLSDSEAVLNWSFEHERVAHLVLPVLYVVAANRVPTVDAVMRRFQDIVPQTETAEVPGAGHMLHTDQPAAVARALAEFFAHHAD